MSIKEEIFNYVMNSPENTNPTVLRSMLNSLENSMRIMPSSTILNVDYGPVIGLYSTDLEKIYVDNLTDLSYFFWNRKDLISLDLSHWNTKNVTNTEYLFRGCANLKSIEGLPSWDMSKVTSITGMFDNCTSLEKLDVHGWDLRSLTESPSYFIGNCDNLKELDISGWNLSNFEELEFFIDVYSLQKINVSNIIFPSSSYILYCLFSSEELQEIIGLETLDLHNCTSIESLFNDCRKLESINGIENWDVSNVKNFFCVFTDCHKISFLDLSKWNMSSAETIESLFDECAMLKIIKFGTLNATSDIDCEDIFYGCESLSELDIRNVTFVSDYETFLEDFTEYLPIDCHIIVKDQATKELFLTQKDFTNIEIAES